MKKIFLIAVIALGSIVVSCSNDSSELEQFLNKKEVDVNQEFYAAQKVEDSLPTDTGGQNGSNPIKP